MDDFDEDDFLPDAEERAKDPYRFSSLGSWFELDIWEEQEAACLICNIDPSTADIKWPLDIRSRSDKLKLISAQFLNEAAWPSSDIPKSKIKEAMLASTELLLGKYWRVYRRATDRPDNFCTVYDVSAYGTDIGLV